MGLLKHRMAIVLLCAAVFLFAVFLVAGSGLAENQAESAGVQAEEMLDPALETYGWFCGEPMDCGEPVTIEGVECRVVTDPFSDRRTAFLVCAFDFFGFDCR